MVEHEHTDKCAPRPCRKCKELKWGCEFYVNRKVCKRCILAANREWRMTDNKGQERNWLNRGVQFTPGDFDRLLEEQDGKCAICKEELVLTPRPPLDHDHVTGDVRGILCKSCNILLGHARDEVKILLAAAQYLAERGGSH